MGPFVHLLAHVEAFPSLPAALADAAAKGSLVLLLAAAAAHTLRNDSAARRHRMWVLALLFQLALPLLTAALPGWDAPILPASGPVAGLYRGAGPTAPAKVPAAPAPRDGAAPVDAPPRTPPSREPSATDTAPRIWSLASLATLAWAVGAVLLLLRFGWGTVQVAWLARRAERVMDPAWLALVQRVALELGISRPLTLLRGDRLNVPVTWGVVYPVVLLPTAAEGWSEERKRVVLLHEAAHVKRWDALTQALSQLTLAVFWFNPLVWMAVRRARSERERACDDHVLAAGTLPSTYVGHLVEIVRTLRPATGPAFAALAMARRSEFEGRMLAVLDPELPRSTTGRASMVFTTVAVALLAIPLATARPGARAATPFPAPAGPAASTAFLAESVSTAEAGKPAPEPLVLSWPDDFGWRKEAPADFRWNGRVAPGGTIEVKGISGHVSAEPSSGSDVEVVAQFRSRTEGGPRVRVQVVEGPDGITVCAVYPSPDPKRPNTCTPGEGAQSTPSGNIDDVYFVVRVPSGVGLVARTITGDVKAASLGGDVFARTITGNLDLSTTGTATGSTVNGSIRARLRDSGGGLSLQTVNGVVDVLVPEGADARLEAKVKAGSISSEFPLRFARSAGGGWSAAGIVGRGGPSATMEAVNGRVTVRRVRP